MDDRKSVTNTPFPSSSGPQYQNEVKCSAFDMEMIFHSYASKTQFHKKGCPLGLVLKGGYLVIGITKFIDIFYFFVRVNTRNSQRFLLAVKNKNNNKQITTTTTTTKTTTKKTIPVRAMGLSNYLGMTLKSRQLIASQILEFCYCYD